MLTLVPFVTCIAWTIANLISIDPGCTISINYKSGDLKEPQPLLLNQLPDIRYPEDDNGTIRIRKNDFIYLACPGKYRAGARQYNDLKIKSYWNNKVRAYCVKDKVFNVKGIRSNFSSLVCRFHTWHSVRKNSLPCLERHSRIEIGFYVVNNFIRTIEVCRDDKTYTTYYTKFEMSKMIGSSQKNYPRPSKFLAGDFYPGIDLDQLYNFKTQLNTLAKILNSAELAKQRLKESVQFLSRGHLVAKADFVYGAMQRSSFWYLNTAPQWQSFNGGNWNSLEISVRLFASERRLNLDVYTGVHGQMTMLDVHNKSQPIYLHADGAVMSVPKFYWKVIYDPLSKQGTAFVGLNDPFINSITNDVYLCKDISKRINWLIWKPHDITAGISYACNVTDLQRAVPTMPKLDVIDILM